MSRGAKAVRLERDQIEEIARRLPAAYFADAQDHTISATPENLERSEQSGAEHREVSGESGAAVHSSDRAQQLHAARSLKL